MTEEIEGIQAIVSEINDAKDQNIVPNVPDAVMEKWLDETMDVMDDGLSKLIGCLADINTDMRYMWSELRCMKRMHRCFASLNLFIVPVICALILCYATSDSRKDYTNMELVMMFLFFVSGNIGFPIYIYTLWNSYHLSGKLKERFENMERFRDAPDDEDQGNRWSKWFENTDEDDAILDLMAASSTERLSDLTRQLRMQGSLENFRKVYQQRPPAKKNSSTSFSTTRSKSEGGHNEVQKDCKEAQKEAGEPSSSVATSQPLSIWRRLLPNTMCIMSDEQCPSLDGTKTVQPFTISSTIEATESSSKQIDHAEATDVMPSNDTAVL